MEQGKQNKPDFDSAQTVREILEKMWGGGQTPQEAFQVEPEFLEDLYAQAYRFYQSGKYLEAVPLFRLLIMMNEREPKYLFGLAASFHLLKEYREAIQVYTIYSLLKPLDPTPHYHIADCFLKIGDPSSAMVSFQLSIERSGEKEAYSTLKERAALSIESLKLHNR